MPRCAASPRLFATALMFALFACAPLNPPNTFIVSRDESGVWRSVVLRDNLSPDVAWQTTADALARSYDLEVIDKASGYIRTSWKYTYIVNNRVVDRYRSRIVIKFQGNPWTTAEVKSEANWLSGAGGWELGYDTRLLEDVFGDLQGRIGRVRR